MNILVTGANGQLGKELLDQGRQSPLEAIGTDLPELDITDYDQAAKTIGRYKPSLVVNSAAFTDVDKAETEHRLAFRVNRDGPTFLARICADQGIPLIHISTDYVFDGQKQTPYLESDPVSPIGVYAQSKAEGEHGIRMHLAEHIILRTSWMYGVYGRNFVKTMLRLGKEHKVVRVVNDQFGSPTSAQDMAQTIFTIIFHLQKNAPGGWGTYHFCGGGVTSWYQFAGKIFDLAQQHHLFSRPHVEPVPSDQYPTPAKRPANSALDCTRARKNFGLAPRPWQISLESTINRILAHGIK